MPLANCSWLGPGWDWHKVRENDETVYSRCGADDFRGPGGAWRGDMRNPAGPYAGVDPNAGMEDGYEDGPGGPAGYGNYDGYEQDTSESATDDEDEWADFNPRASAVHQEM